MEINQIYLDEINKLTEKFTEQKMEVFLGGGFSIDGYLGRFTRSHGDLDVDIVGQLPWKEGYQLVKTVLEEIYLIKIFEKRGHWVIKDDQKEIEVEYVQEIEKDKTYRFHEGELSFDLPFYLRSGGRIGKQTFNIENPHFAVAIKLLNPIAGKGFREKDRQDLNLLLPKLDQKSILYTLRYQLDYLEKFSLPN